MYWKLDLEDEGGVGVGGSNYQAADGEGGGALVRDLAVLDVQLRLLCKICVTHALANGVPPPFPSLTNEKRKPGKGLGDQNINMLFIW
jgi:hypothetical protein